MYRSMLSKVKRRWDSVEGQRPGDTGQRVDHTLGFLQRTISTRGLRRNRPKEKYKQRNTLHKGPLPPPGDERVDGQKKDKGDRTIDRPLLNKWGETRRNERREKSKNLSSTSTTILKGETNSKRKTTQGPFRSEESTETTRLNAKTLHRGFLGIGIEMKLGRGVGILVRNRENPKNFSMGGRNENKESM